MAYTDIDKPENFFNIVTYTGNGSANQSMTGVGFKPDFLWIKRRNASERHVLTNAQMGVSDGAYKWLDSADQAGEFSGGTGVASFDSDGFTIKTSDSTWNANGSTYVFWSWKANGGTTTSVSASGTGSGCVNACTYQANTTSGVSIITYTGRDDQLNNAQESKLTHGLGVAPSVFICKRRDGTSNWYYLGGNMSTVNNGWNNVHLVLNQTAGANGNSYTSNTEPDSTYIYLGNELVNTTDEWVGYAFAEKQGYSKFGTYYGNASTNGEFIYLGFKPALVIFKVLSDPNYGWSMADAERSPHNQMNKNLYANSDVAETTDAIKCDFFSNGVKLRGSTYPANAGGTNTFAYFAFAENPFVTSTGVPTTAR